METCVLIPSEFSLMLREKDSYLHLLNGLKNLKNHHHHHNHHQNNNRQQNETEKRTESETGVCVYSNQSIPKGTCFLPFQGTIRLDRLDVYSLLNDDDVSIKKNFSVKFLSEKFLSKKNSRNLFFQMIHFISFFGG